MGGPFFDGLSRGFRQLVDRYSIRFGSAADLGCGTGQFACYVASRWRVPVFGVDRSIAMLRQAHRHCHRGVRFLHQDLRQLQLPHPVDLATANFDTLNHITGPGELDRVLSRVSVNLRRGGHFIFDFLTPCLGEAVRSACREVEGAGTMCQRIDWVSPGGLFRTRLVLRRRGGTQPLRISQLERAYPVAEVRAALDRAGMRILGAHEADTLRELRRCVPRVVIVARRTGCTAGDRRCSHP